MANNGIEYGSPVGRLVGGSFKLVQETDTKTKQPKVNADGTPSMTCYFSVAYQKGVPEVENFINMIKQAAASFWPQFFPQGPLAPSTHRQFAFKITDGDGFKNDGTAYSTREGYAGHHVVRYQTAYPPKCFVEGKFQAHEVLQAPDDVIKLGDYVRVIGQIKGNGSDVSQQQIPGISIYPNIVSIVAKGVEIKTGINAEEAMKKYALGAVPAGATGAPLSAPNSGMPAPNQGLPAPNQGLPPQQYQPAPNQGLPAPNGGMPTPNGGMPTPPVQQGPQYTIAPATLQQYPTATVEGLLAQGWTAEAAVAQGVFVKHY